MALLTKRWPGALTFGLSLFILFVWIPLDISSGLFEKVRRSVVLGDAFAPAVAAGLIGIGGLLLLVFPHHRAARTPDLSMMDHVRHAAGIVIILALSLGLMRYAGPFLVSVVFQGDPEYRLLRDTQPWKYIGFVLGGTCLITSLITWVEGRFRMAHWVVAMAVVAVLILLYDLPFDDLLLPPNGDV